LTGADIVAGDVDERFLVSLRSVALEFKKMYPRISFSGNLEANPVPSPEQCDPSKYCVLYSGGVDSTCTLIRNLGKRPSVLTVRGAPDLPLQDNHYWNQVRKKTQPFLDTLGVESHLVETNALGMVNQQAIHENFRDRLKVGWWEELAFGLFLLAISAPYAYSKKVGVVMIGSSNTARTQVPWGSMPSTDEKVKWADVSVIHDSYDLERGGKIGRVIAPYAMNHGGYVPLRVCIGRRSIMSEGDSFNCGECPKCMMVELLLTIHGVDPGESGFNVSPATLANLRKNLVEGKIKRSYDEISWSYIKENGKSAPEKITEKHPGLREFLDWFATWDERVRTGRRFLDLVAPPGTRRREVARAGFGKRANSTSEVS
jgi:7-cyano-7-deazaguanine synthase in queuosine biosynthesis